MSNEAFEVVHFQLEVEHFRSENEQRSFEVVHFQLEVEHFRSENEQRSLEVVHFQLGNEQRNDEIIMKRDENGRVRIVYISFLSGFYSGITVLIQWIVRNNI